MQLHLSPMCQAFEKLVRQAVKNQIHRKSQPLGTSPEVISRDSEEG